MFKRKILVIDDDMAFTQLIVEYFKTWYDVLTANNLEDAIRIFRNHRPKVILLDFNMPVMNGDGFLPVVRGIDPTIRAIVVTGCIEEDVEQRFKGMGYYAYFEKGTLSLEALRGKVNEALNY